MKPLGFLAALLLAAPLNAAPCTSYVALTFDDGPTPSTALVLDALKANGLKATFFLIGERVQLYPAIAKRIVDEGHIVGNHTWAHNSLVESPDPVADLKATNDAIFAATGVTPTMYRPPYGDTNDIVRAAAATLNLQEALWSQDSFDWTGWSMWSTLNQLTITPDGGSILMHDWVPGTLQAIPWIKWYFSTYWASAPICPGRLVPTTGVQPVVSWMGQFFFLKAVTW